MVKNCFIFHREVLIIKYRSENSIKNKFYCIVRKFVRKINKIKVIYNKNKSKKIKFKSICKILQANEEIKALNT